VSFRSTPRKRTATVMDGTVVLRGAGIV
jgi:hypothetical protein